MRQPFPGLVPPPGMIPPPNIPLGLMQPIPGGLPVLPPNMPRMMPPPPGPLPPHSRPSQPISGSSSTATSASVVKPPILSAGGSDSEKVGCKFKMYLVWYSKKYSKLTLVVFQAALIMQVLQLTDEQIAVLPAEQRQSILVLKEQIAKSAKR